MADRTTTVALVTCSLLGTLSPDDELLASALRARDVTVRPVLWDAQEPPAGLDAVVVRSAWNYHLAPQAFERWIERASVESPVYNDASILKWNAHKGYLLELERRGIAIAPTVLVKQSDPVAVERVMRDRGWSDVVVKPAISASSYMTKHVGEHGAALADGEQLLAEILATRDAVIQPFLEEVHRRGERNLVFIERRFSHALTKAPFTLMIDKRERPVEAEAAEIALGERVLALLPVIPLYARIDMLRTDDGVDRITEVELIEPELYFRFHPSAADRFAEAVIARLSGS